MKQYEVITQGYQFGSRPSKQYIQATDEQLDEHRQAWGMSNTRIISMTEIHEGHPEWKPSAKE